MCGPPPLCYPFGCVRPVLETPTLPPPPCIRQTLALSSLFQCWCHRFRRYDGSRLQVSVGGNSSVLSYTGDAELFSPLKDGQSYVGLVASTDGGDAQQHSVSSLDVSSAFAAAIGTCFLPHTLLLTRAHPRLCRLCFCRCSFAGSSGRHVPAEKCGGGGGAFRGALCVHSCGRCGPHSHQVMPAPSRSAWLSAWRPWPVPWLRLD